jgi:hypothetical protein
MLNKNLLPLLWVLFTAFSLSSCSTTPNTNLYSQSYAAVQTAQPLISGTEPQTQSSSVHYGDFVTVAEFVLSDDISSNIGSYEWLFVRGITMSEKELEESSLRREIKQYLRSGVPEVDKSKLMESENRVRCLRYLDGGEMKFQFVPLYLKWRTEESATHDYVVFREPEIQCYGAGLKTTGKNTKLDFALRIKVFHLKPYSPQWAEVADLQFRSDNVFPQMTSVSDQSCLTPCINESFPQVSHGPYLNEPGRYKFTVEVIESKG